MFDILCKDLIQTVYEYDSTYRDKFNDVLDNLICPKMKILQKFLRTYNGVDMTIMGNMWQVMRRVTYYNDNNYFEITLFNTIKSTFYVMSKKEKMRLDDNTFAHSPMIIKNHLYELDADHIADFIGCNNETIELIQNFVIGTNTINMIIYDLLGNEYSHYVRSLRDHGIYDEHVHRHLFRDFMHKRSLVYLPHDVYNYEIFIDDDGEEYTIFWNISSNPVVEIPH